MPDRDARTSRVMYCLYESSWWMLKDAYESTVRSFPPEEVKKMQGVKYVGSQVGIVVDAYPPEDTPPYRKIEGWLQRVYGRNDIRLSQMVVSRKFSAFRVGLDNGIPATLQTPSWVNPPQTRIIESTQSIFSHASGRLFITHFDLSPVSHSAQKERSDVQGARVLAVPPRILRAMSQILTQENPYPISLIS